MKLSGGQVVASVLLAVPVVFIGAVAVMQLVSGDRTFGYLIIAALSTAAAVLLAEKRGSSIVVAWFLGAVLGIIGVAVVAGLPRSTMPVSASDTTR